MTLAGDNQSLLSVPKTISNLSGKSIKSTKTLRSRSRSPKVHPAGMNEISRPNTGSTIHPEGLTPYDMDGLELNDDEQHFQKNDVISSDEQEKAHSPPAFSRSVTASSALSTGTRRSRSRKKALNVLKKNSSISSNNLL